MNIRRFFCCLLGAACLFCCLSACTAGGGNADSTSAPQSIDTSDTTATLQSTALTGPIYAIWISYYELPKAINVTVETYEEQAQQMCKAIADAGLNTVFLHVRPFADAIYPSAIFPWSAKLGGAQGEDPGYDPLQIFIDAAHANGLTLHAWLNPFRVSAENNLEKLNNLHPARVILEDSSKENDSLVYRTESGIYFNPAAAEVQKLVLDGVKEILDHYAVDGIHIDDYFYPTTDSAIDQKEYAAYKKAGGSLSLADWRCENIHTFVAALYAAAHTRGKQMSISPGGNISRNKTQYCADAAQWLQNPGYADFIIPQLYFGFLHETLPFAQTAQAWRKLCGRTNTALVWGLAAYKIGQTDENAGSGAQEWVDSKDLLARQLKLIQDWDETAGFALFSFAYLFGEKAPEGLLDAIKAYTLPA